MPVPPHALAHALVCIPLPTTTSAAMPPQNICLEAPMCKGGATVILQVEKAKGRNANPSFFQGGTVGCGTSTCAVCLGCHEHEYAKCSASKLWNGGKVCVQRNEQGQLVFLDDLPVCFNFQTLVGCSDPSHPSQHICSGYGKSGHGAQQCAQAQKD